MDQHELMLCCRRGDLQKAKYLVEQKEVCVNFRDKWDSTPLYYACLCGHEEVVQYLLDNGVRCEANTFDGERCLYGALTDNIKRLLMSYNMVSAKVMRRDLYEEFLRKLSEPGMYQDVTFNVHGVKFPVHRCVLSARNSYFADLFRTRWKGRKEIKLKHRMILPGAFKQIIQYLYSGLMEIPIEEIDACITLAKHLKMHKLIELIEARCKSYASFEFSKPGVIITSVLVEEVDKSQLQLELGTLADIALPQELCSFASGELPFEPEFASVYADLELMVQGHKFYCHKAFFCGRSDYFRALVNDHFGEGWTSEDQLPVLELHNINVDIFVKVLYYLYQECCELSEENVYDVLCAADMFLLPGLKRFCANAMAKFLSVNDVVTVLRTARMFNLPRLEDQCAEFIAHNLEQVLKLEEFEELVLSDASEVKDREETDSIDIIDSVRFHITSFIKDYAEITDAEDHLKLMDNFLTNLGLEC